MNEVLATDYNRRETDAPDVHGKPRRNRVAAACEMPDLGILNQLLADPAISDILVNGLHPVYADRAGILEDTGLKFQSHDDVWEIAERILEAVGQRWDLERPMVDTRLPDGSRVNIVAPPMAIDGVSISIRKFPNMEITLNTMAEQGLITPNMAAFLAICVEKKLNVIVSGGTSSGKTTLLNALSAAISPKERIVTIEDAAELRLQQPHVVRLESKPALDGDRRHTGVSIRDLVKNALRMRPDRVILGESRGGEAFDVLQAMNTGHEGSMTTLHANLPRDALARLETMINIALPHITSAVIRQQIAGTVHLIIQTSRAKDGVRRITHVTEIAGLEGQTVMMQDLITYAEPTEKQPGGYRWVGGSSRNPIVTEAARLSGMLQGMGGSKPQFSQMAMK